MKKIAWLPENLDNNRSFYGFKKATALAGAENISEKDLYKNPRKVDYLVLNFYEDIQKKFGFHLIAYVGRWIRLHYFKFCGIKVIWMVNNKVPHDDNKAWAIRMMRTLIKSSDKIIILCTDTLSVLKNLVKKENVWRDKIIYLPHPNYIGAYKKTDLPIQPDGEAFKLLFFGSIRPYKNVDVLIRAFKRVQNNNIELTIAGGCKSESYRQYIQKLASESNIKLMLQYIDDDEILSLISENSMLVFPYDNETTLNSGSIILACSAGKTFIAPKIGTVKDFPDDSLFYGYEYKTESEHEDKLVELIKKSYADYIEDRKSLENKGNALYAYMHTMHSTEKLAEIWKQALDL